MPNYFYQITSATSKDVQIISMRVTTERLLHLQRQAIHAFSHVRAPHRQPHPDSSGNRYHRRPKTFTTRVSAAASTSAPTIT